MDAADRQVENIQRATSGKGDSQAECDHYVLPVEARVYGTRPSPGHGPFAPQAPSELSEAPGAHLFQALNEYVCAIRSVRLYIQYCPYFPCYLTLANSRVNDDASGRHLKTSVKYM
jgi:hypothetical protein